MPLNVGGSDSLYWKTGIDTTGLKKGSKQSVGILAGLAKNVSALDVFVGLSVSATLAFKKIAKDSYDFSRKFESAMKEVQTISLAVQKNYDGISQTIVKLSKGVPDMATKLTQAYYQIVSAGYDGAKGLKLLEASAKLAVAGVTDTFVAADTLTSIMNAYGKEAGTAMEISDKLFTTVKLGKVTMEQIGSTLSTVTGLAAQAGLKFNELMGIVAKGTKTMRPKIMITGIKGILNALIKPQQDALDLAKDLNLEFSIRAVKEKGFVQWLKEFNEATKDNIEAQSTLFGNVRGLSGILAVATEEGGKFSDVLEEMKNSAGATEEAFRIMIETTENQLALLSNIIRAKLKPLGDSLLVQVNSIAKAISINLTSAFKDAQKASEFERAEFEKNIAVIEMLWEKTNKTTTEKEILAKAIETLQDKYPDYLSNIDTEKTSYENLTIAINKTRIAMEDKLILQMKIAEQEDLLREQIRLKLYENELIKEKALLQKQINELEKDEGVIREKFTGQFQDMLDEENESYQSKIRTLGLVDFYLANNRDKQVEIKDELEEIDKVYGELIRKQEDSNEELKETSESVSEIGKMIKATLSDLGILAPKFKVFDLDFSKGTLTLTELMRVFHESIEHLEAFRQAGIDTTDLLIKNWENFTDNVKQYYGEDSATYIATLNLKKDADREYFEWKKDKWIEEHQFMVNTLGVMEDGYDTFVSTILDMEITGKKRREIIWDSMKSSFVNLLADMLKRTIADILIRMAITKTSEALAITSAAITGTAVASSWATAAAMTSLATLGANAIPATAGITSTVGLAKLLSAIKLNRGGEVDKKSEGGEITSGSDQNVDSILTFLTKKEIVISRDPAQENRKFLLNLNKDKDYLRKNYIPRNLGGVMDRASNIRIPDFPSFPDFPSKMSITSDQLERLIKVTKAQTMNQISRGSPSINVNIKSDLDMERFIIEFDKVKTRMTERGYEN